MKNLKILAAGMVLAATMTVNSAAHAGFPVAAVVTGFAFLTPMGAAIDAGGSTILFGTDGHTISAYTARKSIEENDPVAKAKCVAFSAALPADFTPFNFPPGALEWMKKEKGIGYLDHCGHWYIKEYDADYKSKFVRDASRDWDNLNR